jgi:hypothetical protein
VNYRIYKISKVNRIEAKGREVQMSSEAGSLTARTIDLETKPDCAEALQRVEAWYHQAIIDRPPVRFTRHNAEYEVLDDADLSRWPHLKARWFDEEYQIERFLRQLHRQRYLGETFPIFWPNLGPNVFAACYGAPLEFGEVTSWAEPILNSYDQPVAINWQSEYLVKLESLTHKALQICDSQFIVGYTDLHPGMDWLAALRGSEQLCMDFYDYPDEIKALQQQVTTDFLSVFAHFDVLLKRSHQPSVSWMGIPFLGRMHIPSCDFATLISPAIFQEFAWPALQDEVVAMTHNIFHLDGKGVARHLDAILELPNVNAIQWVQGVGLDQPILQWIPLIQKIQAAGKSVVVDMAVAELEPFIDAVEPEGILLCLPSESEAEELAILARVARW